MKEIEWKIFCRSSAQKVFSCLSTDKGRESFWVESSKTEGPNLHFRFPNGIRTTETIITRLTNKEFCLSYFGTKACFYLEAIESEGVIVTLINSHVPDSEYNDMHAGWISVLLALKACVESDLDLRNHDSRYTWDKGFVDN